MLENKLRLTAVHILKKILCRARHKREFLKWAGGLVSILLAGAVLAEPLDQNFDAVPVGSLGSNNATLNGITYSNNDAFNIAIVNDGFIAGGSDHAIGFRSSGSNASTLVGFKTQDGSEFKLNGFVIDRGFGSDNTLTVRAYRNNVEITSTSLNVTSGTATLDVSGASAWEYIDEIRIEGADLGMS